MAAASRICRREEATTTIVLTDCAVADADSIGLARELGYLAEKGPVVLIDVGQGDERPSWCRDVDIQWLRVVEDGEAGVQALRAVHGPEEAAA